MKIKSSHLKRIIKEEVDNALQELNDPYGDYQRGQKLGRLAQDAGGIARDVGSGIKIGAEIGGEAIEAYSDFMAQYRKVPKKAIWTVLKKTIKSPIKAAKLIAFFRNSPEDQEAVLNKWQEYFRTKQVNWEELADATEDLDYLSPKEGRKIAKIWDESMGDMLEIIVGVYNEETGSTMQFESLMRED